MGEDITKLKKNIEKIKKIVEGGRKDETKKDVTPEKPPADKRASS